MTPPTSAEATRNARTFRRRIRAWGRANVRSFPWRSRRQPYEILVAEMMLRRTQAKQVVPVYERFLLRFPIVGMLAHADDKEVAVLLRPLGLAWRVPSFRAMAREVVSSYDGQVPTDRNSLMALPGVGPYVADAVRCLSLNIPGPIVDTNTVRVAARYFGFPYNAESRRRAAVRVAVSELASRVNARESNLALLDFAAGVCTARAPKCNHCPVSELCKSAEAPRRSSRSLWAGRQLDDDLFSEV
jgi:A/G-specific adenine glycosylase